MLLDMASDAFGDRVVVGRLASGFSASDLRARALSGAAAIRGAGADAVVYLAPNGPAFPVAMFAAAYAGVPLVPLNYRLGRDQLQSLLAKHPNAIGIADEAGLAHFDAAGIGGVEFMNAAEDDAALVSVPPYHIAAVANVISNLYGGRRTIVLEQFQPEQ